jgi:hypothetical protein
MKMKRSKNRISKILCGLMAAMALCSAGMMTVSASNYHDTNFGFHFNRGYNRTEARAKEDATSAFMNCKWADNTVYDARVYASPDLTGTPFDVSGGHVYRFTQGTHGYLINYAYETAQQYGTDCYALIQGERISGTFANGTWSPDSI